MSTAASPSSSRVPGSAFGVPGAGISDPEPGTRNPEPDSRDQPARWPLWRFIGAAVFVAVGIALTWAPWSIIVSSGWNDEESSQILLVPIAVAWLVWARRDLLRDPGGARPTATWLGPVILALGWASLIYGYDIRDNEHWLFGAILIAVGGVVAFLGGQVLWRLWPAFVVLGFLIPVPGLFRLMISLPLQSVMAQLAEHVCGVMGILVSRSGNQLIINEQTIEVAEACNGMRMVFALFLVVYTYTFATPLRWPVRILLLAAAPLLALLCNLIRIVPTVLLYGYASNETGEGFHDLAGWVMVPVALMLLMGSLSVLQWAGVPVMQRAKSAGPAAEMQQSNKATERQMTERARGRWVGLWACRLVAPAVAVLLLGGVAWSQQSRKPSPHVLAYHQAVRDAADRVPPLIAQWYGTDTQVSVAAVEMLRPNVIISRQYQNVETSRTVKLLFVHSRDAIDMMFHYPPVCYKYAGWTATASDKRTWRLGDRDVDLMEYRFTRHDPTASRSILITNFMVLPTGMGLDMDDVRQVAHAPSARMFGAGQLQVIFDDETSEAERQAVLDAVVRAYQPVFDAVLAARSTIDGAPASDAAGDGAPTPSNYSVED